MDKDRQLLNDIVAAIENGTECTTDHYRECLERVKDAPKPILGRAFYWGWPTDEALVLIHLQMLSPYAYPLVPGNKDRAKIAKEWLRVRRIMSSEQYWEQSVKRADKRNNDNPMPGYERYRLQMVKGHMKYGPDRRSKGMQPHI